MYVYPYAYGDEIFVAAVPFVVLSIGFEGLSQSLARDWFVGHVAWLKSDTFEITPLLSTLLL